jgi:hypothetical protein
LADSVKASITQAQKFLRHRRSTTTDNYIKTLDPELKQIEKLLYKQTYTEDKTKGVR